MLAILRFLDQAIEIVHGPELGIDCVIVGYIVAEVNKWRGETRRDPDRHPLPRSLR